MFLHLLSLLSARAVSVDGNPFLRRFFSQSHVVLQVLGTESKTRQGALPHNSTSDAIHDQRVG